MATETNWQTHRQEATESAAADRFSRRPIDTPPHPQERAWSTTLSDMTHEMPTVPSYVTTIGIAAAATATGIAIGYWLGGRRVARRRSSFSLNHADLADFARLAPEAAHLLKNPVVRAFALKLIARQLQRYRDR